MATVATADPFHRALKWAPDGPWQSAAERFVLDNRFTILQGPRQATGKSEIASNLITRHVVAGMPTVIGCATKSQSMRIITRRADRKCYNILEKAGLKRVVDNTGEFVYPHGGACLSLSASKSAKEKEGYTAEFVVIDEGHNADEETMKFYMPFIARAMREGRGKIMVLGVGGHKHSLIESLKDKPGWQSMKVTPEECVAHDERWQGVFDEFRATLTPSEYQQHIECLPVAAGTAFIFEDVPTGNKAYVAQWEPQWSFGIDVGFYDYTVCTVVGRVRDYYWVEDFLALEQVKYDDQARQLYEYINRYFYHPHRICVELNGVGRTLHQLLERYIPGITGATINDKSKAAYIETAQAMFRAGRLTVDNEAFRAKLEPLTMDIDEWGKIKYEHSDYLSSLLMAVAVMEG